VAPVIDIFAHYATQKTVALLYEKVVKHDLPILLHPANWECYPLVDAISGPAATDENHTVRF
jgi:hypothetical protein